MGLFNKKIQIDNLTCSLFYETLFKKNNYIKMSFDPIYHLKSIKNQTEIKNTIKSHIFDGVALTKFIFWLKDNYTKKKLLKSMLKKNYLVLEKKINLLNF